MWISKSRIVIVLLICPVYFILSFRSPPRVFNPSLNHKSAFFPAIKAEGSEIGIDIDKVFGAEFSKSAEDLPNLSSTLSPPSSPSSTAAALAMKSYAKLRSTFLADSIFVSALGFSLAWYIGSYKDATSFALGSICGIAYSILLGKYVEKIGKAQKNRLVDTLRFAPVILLIALYGKFKTIISIIPELMGFFTSYQLASLLQIFNDRLYDVDDINPENIN
jgi:hypothetical protein